MATVRGITLTPNEVTVVDLDDAGAVEVTSDGSAPVYYTLDGSDPTPSSTLVIPEGALNDAARAASPGTTIKMLSDGSPSITVAAYSQTEAEATSAVRDVHAALAAEIQTALVEATTAQEMIAEDRPKLEATMVTAAAADEAHAALHARIDAIELTPGPPGDPGKSAYQIARDHGYGGTETQWLATLKGEKGERGDQGQQGNPGTDGTNGADGVSPALGIGTVSTLAPGSSATASLGGTQANPTLNLGIPQGAPGSGGGSGVTVRELAADRAFSTVTYADITDWVIALPANDVVTLDGILVFQSAALTTGFGFGARVTAVGGGSVLTPSRFLLTFEYQTSATAWATATQTVPTTPMAVTTAAYVANSGILCRITGQVEMGATAGELRLQARSEVAGSAITLRKGSPLRVM